MEPLLEKYLPLEANSSALASAQARRATQRQKDHYSHFILRLAFASTQELRMRFSRAERALFRLRYASDDPTDRAAFVSALNIDWWEQVSDTERADLLAGADAAAFAAAAVSGGDRRGHAVV